jgi:hypothetical protein
VARKERGVTFGVSNELKIAANSSHDKSFGIDRKLLISLLFLLINNWYFDHCSYTAGLSLIFIISFATTI